MYFRKNLEVFHTLSGEVALSELENLPKLCFFAFVLVVFCMSCVLVFGARSVGLRFSVLIHSW